MEVECYKTECWKGLTPMTPMQKNYFSLVASTVSMSRSGKIHTRHQRGFELSIPWDERIDCHRYSNMPVNVHYDWFWSSFVVPTCVCMFAYIGNRSSKGILKNITATTTTRWSTILPNCCIEISIGSKQHSWRLALKKTGLVQVTKLWNR